MKASVKSKKPTLVRATARRLTSELLATVTGGGANWTVPPIDVPPDGAGWE